MIRAALFAAAVWLQTAAALAQVCPPNPGFLTPGPFNCPPLNTIISSTYEGPIDAAGSAASDAYSLRCASAALATGTTKVVNVRNSSTSGTQDIVCLANGNFDSVTAATFATNVGTCSGTISGTTATVTGCTGTPLVNDPVYGTGLVQPVKVVSCSLVAGAGTCTLTSSQTVSVAETLTFQVALFVTEFYDQVGSFNLTQATTANQPQLLLDCGDTLPCMQLNGTSQTLTSSSTLTTHAQPVTIALVMDRTGNTGAVSLVAGIGTGLSSGYSTAGIMRLNAGTVATFAGADNTFISSIATFSGSNSHGYYNGVSTSTLSTGTAGFGNSAGIAFGSNSAGTANWLTGLGREMLLFTSGLTSGTAASLCHNQRYWGAFGC